MEAYTIVESVEQTAEGVNYKEPKSGRSIVVDLSSSVVKALKTHRARQADMLLALLTDGWMRHLEGLDLPRIRFHDLRHTHETQLLAAGVHPKIASERLGHSTIGITLDLYSHVMPGMQANAAAQIDDMISRAAVEKGDGKG
ncbi:site-specific integrase [Ensifer sp. PDNC004]|uniref:site-specific integrase n=1 Tax=Ensifer sp. PDNC004 TaxID=2811423 RepID=UPI001FEFE630|nr:site-specific integrase [Ensifer sp. PDNC004]